ncbi:chorismate-binding protein [Winogradskyella sp. UBA3174]|uniref:chorismate-binding protein n=1 Tax=Winogradskyella sp. UBA3174 TaxID=1947785 RepID=UPI0025CDB47B|nr:chorismate-binding protein [Winogradskyella sp. UBA3174]|tara:strand:+ start:6900 stop:8015 length:1116 start_codon:yes stop_codon:yes gene_type:complete
MDLNSFFEALEKQYANKLPFVVYSRPINSIIKCWLQQNDAMHTTDAFSESGFVFAPFNLSDKSILLPQDKCEHYILETNKLEVTELNSHFEIDTKDRDEHINLVEKGIDSINKGQLEKVVLSRKVEKSTDVTSPLDTFKRLFNTYENAMVYCWYHPKVGLWLGATPELLFKVEGKRLTTISLAGTQPYQEHKDVVWTNKEIEEQQIVTDYITKQIEPCTKQVTISKVETIRAGNLLHLKSRIISVIDDSTTLRAVIEALHPTPAVCGFPKQEAKDFILKSENYNREYYTGFLGELNLKQAKTRNTNRRNVENNAYAVVKTQSNFYVNLRCTQLKDNKALIYVGGGITKDSIAENEWEETVNKTKTIGSILN